MQLPSLNISIGIIFKLNFEAIDIDTEKHSKNNCNRMESKWQVTDAQFYLKGKYQILYIR